MIVVVIGSIGTKLWNLRAHLDEEKSKAALSIYFNAKTEMIFHYGGENTLSSSEIKFIIINK